MIHFTYPGPICNISYHNHSNWSDGAVPPEQMCRAAKASGLKEFGLSDHYVQPPKGGVDFLDWSIDVDHLDRYIELLQKLKSELDDESFTLRIGLEIDFFYENIDSVLAELKKYPLDYLIGSVHYAGRFPVDYTKESWSQFSEEQMAEICEIYWNKLEGAARRKEFSFLGHLDLPKKFGIINNDDYFTHAVRILDIVQETGIGIELNTAGWFKECEEQYPSLAILKEANKRKIPVIVNPDAHDPAHLLRGFKEASEILVQAGYPDRNIK